MSCSTTYASTLAPLGMCFCDDHKNTARVAGLSWITANYANLCSACPQIQCKHPKGEKKKPTKTRALLLLLEERWGEEWVQQLLMDLLQETASPWDVTHKHGSPKVGTEVMQSPRLEVPALHQEGLVTFQGQSLQGGCQGWPKITQSSITQKTFNRERYDHLNCLHPSDRGEQQGLSCNQEVQLLPGSP